MATYDKYFHHNYDWFGVMITVLFQISVGSNSVWGVKSDGGVIVRMGIGPDTPLGKEWVTVDGEPMRQVYE